MLRRFALPVLILVAVVGYVVYWYQVAARVPAWVAQWADQARVRGYHVEYGAVDVGGFPFKLEVSVADVAFGRDDGRGAALWRGAFVRGLLKPWDFERVLLTLPDQHTLEPAVGGSLAVRQAANQTVLVIDDGAPRIVAVDLRDVTIEDAAGTRSTLGTVEVRYERDETDDDEDRRTVGIKLIGVDPGVVVAPGMPALIDELTAVARLVGTPPEAAAREPLGRWRDGGGVLEFDMVRVRWGAFDLAADGTATLDDQFRPLFAFTVNTAGWDGVLEAATAAGALPPGQAFAIGAALDAIAQPGDQGVERATIAVSAQDGQVFVGPLAVGRVPALAVP
jgi:hypothetical protein